jgi:hypothetical protein
VCPQKPEAVTDISDEELSAEARCINGAGIRVAPIEREVGSKHPVTNNDNEAVTAICMYIFFISSP